MIPYKRWVDALNKSMIGCGVFFSKTKIRLQDLEKLVHTFIFSKLNFSNGVFTGLSKNSIRQLQVIQNAAAPSPNKNQKLSQLCDVIYTKM